MIGAWRLTQAIFGAVFICEDMVEYWVVEVRGGYWWWVG